MNFFPRNMHEMKVFVLEACESDVDIRQVLVICLENEVSIIQEVLELLDTIVYGIDSFSREPY